MITYTDSGKLRVDRAIVVEGRDDIDAVSRACDALIIATHGAGIAQETWDIIGKAYREIGIVIMTVGHRYTLKELDRALCSHQVFGHRGFVEHAGTQFLKSEANR